MYTVLIVDDEPLIRNGMKKIIDWETLGFSEILLAEDGQDALEILREKKVDLVLTDIVMPFMDGLELSEIISREFPQIHIVILTGHEDFEYARKSIQLGVKDYILKPVGAETLYKQMQGICERLHFENTERKYIASMKTQLHQSIPVMQNQMLDRIVCRSGIDINSYLERCSGLGIHLEQGPFEIGLMDVDLSEKSSRDRDLYLFAVKNIVKECIGEKHYVFEDGRDCLALLFCCSFLGEEEDLGEITYQMMEILQKTVYQTIQIKTTCATGSLVESAQKLNESYIGARKALECKYSFGDDHVYDIRDLDYLEKTYYYPAREIKMLITSVQMGDEKQIAKAVHEIIGFVGMDKPLSVINIRMNYISSITALLREASEMKKPSEAIWNEGMEHFQTINTMKKPGELEQSLYRFACRISSELKQVQKNSGQKIIEKVREFVEMNYKDPDLSLAAVSEYVSVSMGYLSGLFKKETGTNFIKYLNDIRMEKSEELLLTTDMKTYEIAYETGFSNPHYFSIAFKKHSGMSPSEFRNME